MLASADSAHVFHTSRKGLLGRDGVEGALVIAPCRWVHTIGMRFPIDVAYLDDEGFVFIVDRIKDLVIRGGENIGCGTVEAALLEHSGFLEASVYGVPDDRLGEEVGATVYCSTPVDEEELRAFLASRLARFEIPRYLTFASEPLPRIAAGKIFKRKIREDASVRWSSSSGG